MRLLPALILLLAPSSTSAQPSITVPVDGGQFVFSGPTVHRDGSFTASLQNQSKYEWAVAEFRVTLLDKKSSVLRARIEMPPVTEFGIKPGEIKAVRHPMGVDGKKVAQIQIAPSPGSIREPVYQLRLTKPVQSEALVIDDPRFSLKWVVTKEQATLELANRTSSPVQIDWAGASFVGADGISHRAIPDGTRYIDRNQAPPATVVPPGATARHAFIPSSTVRYSEYLKEWVVDRFLPYGPKAVALKGKSLGFLLPVVVDGKTEQVFTTIEIADVQ